jgi:hypothetical protein
MVEAESVPAVLIALYSHHRPVTIDIDLLFQVRLRRSAPNLEAPRQRLAPDETIV